MVERFQVSELGGPILGLAVAAEHLPAVRVIQGDLPNGHVRAKGRARGRALRASSVCLGEAGCEVLGITHCLIAPEPP